jgi:ribose transport system substrate-binding protein
MLALVLLALLIFAAFAGWQLDYFKARPKVAIVTWNQDPYWDLVLDGAQAAANARNIDLSIVRSEPGVKAQAQHVQDLLNQGIQGIAISPNGPPDQLTYLNDVAGKVILVTFDSDAQIPKRRAFIGTDSYAAGQLCAEQIRNVLPDGGDIIISVGSIDMANGRERRQGIIDNLLDRRPDKTRPTDPADAPLKGAHYAVVATILDSGDPAKATAGVADAIKVHPDVKCIVGLFSYSPAAVAKAIDQAGKTGQIKAVGFDESDATQAGVANGSIYCSILQDQYNCGYDAIDVISQAISFPDENAPGGVRFFPLYVRVMKPDNISLLRSSRLIHTPK